MDIYLDQKDWIALARAHHGKDRAAAGLLSFVKAGISGGTIRLPISRTHLLEATKIGNEERRKRFVEVLIYYSRRYVVTPAELVVCGELERWGRGESPKATHIIGRGLLAALGNYATEARTRGISQSEVELEDYRGDSPSAWHFALSRPEFGAFAAPIHAAADRYAATVNTARRQWTLSSKPERLAIYARGVLDDIQSALSPIPADARVAIDRLLALKGDDFLSAVGEIPTVDVLVRIGEAVARDTNQPTKPNDLWDLSFLSVAVPYFDVVVTERTWAHHAKTLRLNERYSCRVLANLDELAAHIKGASPNAGLI